MNINHFLMTYICIHTYGHKMFFNKYCHIEHCKECNIMGYCLECVNGYDNSNNSCTHTQLHSPPRYSQIFSNNFHQDERIILSNLTENCVAWNIADNSCSQCIDNFQLQNYTCVESKVSLSSRSLMLVLVGIIVPVVFAISFCIV